MAMTPNRPEKTATGQPATGKTLDTQALFAGARTLTLIHLGERYQLRITRQGKLILTK